MDIEQIRSLVELMVTNDLSRVEIQDGESRILLRRGHPPVIAPPLALQSPAATLSVAAPVAAGASQPDPAAVEVASEAYIRSPMVGTFYAGSSPEAAPFVSVGAIIGPDTVVCLIEAMKVFNEIKSDVAGRVTRVLVKNGEAVEFDQKLFALTPA